VSPLSAAPPVGPATASGEGVIHRVDATTVVRVSIDPAGLPFSVVATQRLTVHRLGDYYFTVGAPLLSAQATRASQGPLGVRTDSLIWEGFNPGTRILAARLRLRTAAVLSVLPLRVARSGRRITLTNATFVGAGTFTARVARAGLAAALRRAVSAPITHTTPLLGSAVVTGPLRRTTIRVAAPLLVEGSVGRTKVDLRLDGVHPRVTLPAGRVSLTVRVASPRDTGRGRLLDRVLRASLEVARGRQYEQFLANPDLTGTSTTTYRYVTGRPAAARAAPAPRRVSSTWPRSIAVALGLAAAFVAALVVWARS
jgi:hypothetical protein